MNFSADFTYEKFLEYKNVSRETFSHLQHYVELLKKWQKTINLISNATISDIWIRHIIDSAQLIDFCAANDIFDLGSGAGFPGLILAIMGVQKITLVESDRRKCAFLREAARVSKAEVTIINQRVEEISYPDFSTLIARGFASVEAILERLDGRLKMNHNLLLLKGEKYDSEIRAAAMRWSFDYHVQPSLTEKNSAIISLTNIARKP